MRALLLDQRVAVVPAAVGTVTQRPADAAATRIDASTEAGAEGIRMEVDLGTGDGPRDLEGAERRPRARDYRRGVCMSPRVAARDVSLRGVPGECAGARGDCAYNDGARSGGPEANVTHGGAPQIHYRLRGEVAGTSRAYALHLGENWVGSVAGNAIVLPVRGVSRRHALLTIDPEGLTLEDMGSRNGTLVKGVRIQRTRLRTGDEIRVGPVRLRLEEVEPEDTKIAISVSSDDAPAAGLPADDTTGTPVEELGRIGLGLVEGLIGCLCASPEPDLAGLVALLCRQLGATSACIFEVQKGEPVALGTYGVLPDLSRHRRFVELVRGAAASGRAVRAVSIEGDAPLTCALAAGAGPGRLGMVVVGDLRGRGRDVEVLLRMLVPLCQRLRPEALAPAPSPRDEAPGLAFPGGSVPAGSPAMRSLYGQMPRCGQA